MTTQINLGTVKHQLNYDPARGIFLWRFAGLRRKVGQRAGHPMGDREFININGTTLSTLYLAVWIVTLQQPESEPIPFDGNPKNARIANLLEEPPVSAVKQNRIASREITLDMIEYHPNSGYFRWKRGCPNALKRADVPTRQGFAIRIGKGVFRAARMAWLLTHGEFPPHYHVVHLNGDIWDNKLANLKLVNPREPAAPVKPPAKTRSRELPPLEELRARFRYEPKTGKLIWKTSYGVHHSPGDEAGTPDGNGYLKVRAGDKIRFVHRICWALHHGEDPVGKLIDHIDMNPANNRIKNLRLATHAQNSRNRKAPKHNTSGHKGVSWNSQFQKWKATISHEGKMRHFGFFTDKADAVAAVQSAREALHHEFARH